MSYNQTLKTELCERFRKAKTDLSAECRGLFWFARDYSAEKIVLGTEHPAVADRAVRLLGRVCPDVRPVLRTVGNVIHVSAKRPEERAAILAALGPADFGETPELFDESENEAFRAFVRGAFLSCGSMDDPEKNYRLEFLVYDATLAEQFAARLARFGLKPLPGSRGGAKTVCLRDSEDIEDLLTLMGASHRALELMNVKILKDIRNTANRRVNCETANITRTVEAALRQNEAIRRLREDGRFDLLADELREVALLRLMNPEMSVAEMAAACGISKSGVNHRLRKLMRLAFGDETGSTGEGT